ncbi:U-scoloptoxin(16)-Ssd1a [Procambarus clarkii]|uniref:U-scoloptoxin(16)-Ssd1a n=1 Tax=Procambarus clarkii TaxID=6728 RepID=UPI0037442982
MAARLLTLVLLLATVGLSVAAMFIAGAELDPEDPERCLYEGASYSFTEDTQAPGLCEVVRCLRLVDGIYAQITSCGVIEAECAAVDGDSTLPFPDCCPEMQCFV